MILENLDVYQVFSNGKELMECCKLHIIWHSQDDLITTISREWLLTSMKLALM